MKKSFKANTAIKNSGIKKISNMNIFLIPGILAYLCSATITEFNSASLGRG